LVFGVSRIYEVNKTLDYGPLNFFIFAKTNQLPDLRRRAANAKI
jgi:hypothetical protein